MCIVNVFDSVPRVSEKVQEVGKISNVEYHEIYQGVKSIRRANQFNYPSSTGRGLFKTKTDSGI